MKEVSAREAYDQLAASYDSTFDYARPLNEDEQIRRWLQERNFLHGNVADLGCGTGTLLDLAHINYDGYAGIDISPRMIATARKKHPKHYFYCDDMHNMRKLVSDAFDAAVSLYGSFSYCMHPATAARNLMRVLRPGGKFFIMLYGKRYAKRETYIAKDIHIPRNFYTDQGALWLFRHFTDVEVTGWRYVSDGIVDRLPSKTQKKLLSAERRLGRIAPNQGYFLIVTGRKGR